MRLLRAGQRGAPPLNCGVRQRFMGARISRLAYRIAALLLASGCFALIATFLRALKDTFWERNLLSNLFLYWVSAFAALPWVYLSEVTPGRSWRNWLPTPLSLITGGSTFCIVFDLQRKQPWNHTLSQIPESMYWFVFVPATISVILLIRERSRSNRIGQSS